MHYSTSMSYACLKNRKPNGTMAAIKERYHDKKRIRSLPILKTSSHIDEIFVSYNSCLLIVPFKVFHMKVKAVFHVFILFFLFLCFNLQVNQI